MGRIHEGIAKAMDEVTAGDEGEHPPLLMRKKERGVKAD